MSDPEPPLPDPEPTSYLYWKEFSRNWNEDKDHRADDAFLSANFVDFFGKWLQGKTDDSPNSFIQSFDELVKVFWKDPDTYETHIFMVADGSFVEKHPWDGFSPGARVVAVVHRPGHHAFDTKPDERTLCIVGSSDLTSLKGFLQVISWDGRSFRYYQRDILDEPPVPWGYWCYFGSSTDAFGSNSYLGPFNGHVNGSVIMKELHEPWIHWYDPSSPGTFISSLTDDNKKTFRQAPYLTQEGLDLLSALTKGPDKLETMITNGVRNWFETRLINDFFGGDTGKSTLVPSPPNIHRWAAHMFLTTTINMGTATMEDDTNFNIPLHHFFDNEALSTPGISTLLSGVPGLDDFKASISQEEYDTVLDTLELCMIKDYKLDANKGESRDAPPADYFELPLNSLARGDKDPNQPDYVGFRFLAHNSEGQAGRPFHFLHSSLEDAQGIRKVQTLKQQGRDKFLGLFSQRTFSAIMMLDFWNPVYSWKRGVLMRYVPPETTWDSTTGTYDLEARFIQNVTNSDCVKSGLTDSPEYQFLQLLKVPLEDHQRKIAGYLAAIQERLGNPDTRLHTIIDYFKLAESRRRIYRPLPLDEFGATMPYAKAIPFGSRILEMRPDGTVGEIDPHGQKFLDEWTASLSGFDPVIIPPIPIGGNFGGFTAATANFVPKSGGPVPISALPRPALLALPCQSKLRTGTTTGNVLAQIGCPYTKHSQPRQTHSPKAHEAKITNQFTTMNIKSQSTTTPRTTGTPNWEDDILPLITKPYWITPESRAIKKGKSWITAMDYYSNHAWALTKYEDVVKRAVSIYRHLRSKSMPITKDLADYWPEESLEIFRAWANAGFPRDAKDPTAIPKTVIPKPIDPPVTYRVRRDIMSMTAEELAVYQAKLDDRLGARELGSMWQKLGLLHAEWCLHYQEATFPWHRAFLLHVETVLDGYPIPYWNGYSASSSKADSPFAGIPRVFFEKTYIHPTLKVARPNPLRYALSLNGKSKSGNPADHSVVRHPVLEAGRPAGEVSTEAWKQKIALVELYHKQIAHALSQSTYTSSPTAQKWGIPWANILTFSEDQDDKDYPFRFDFDGLFEQVHDNFHGWVGPDMADNTYTAFDPIFLSYHANMDRLAGMFMDSHVESQYTARFPLQPFVEGRDAKKGGLREGQLDVDYTESRKWAFVTVGDMVKDVRSLGYMYAPPVDPDYVPGPADGNLKSSGEVGTFSATINGLGAAEELLPPVQRFEATGGKAITLPAFNLKSPATSNSSSSSSSSICNSTGGACARASNTTEEKKEDPETKKKKIPYVVFMGVGCTSKSYTINVFTANAASVDPDPVGNPDFIGQITRLGMGPAGDVTIKNKSSRKCRVPEASRVLSAAGFEDRLGGSTDEDGEAKEKEKVKIVVTDLETGKVVGKEVYGELPGFEPRIVWLATY